MLGRFSFVNEIPKRSLSASTAKICDTRQDFSRVSEWNLRKKLNFFEGGECNWNIVGKMSSQLCRIWIGLERKIFPKFSKNDCKIFPYSKISPYKLNHQKLCTKLRGGNHFCVSWRPPLKFAAALQASDVSRKYKNFQYPSIPGDRLTKIFMFSQNHAKFSSS